MLLSIHNASMKKRIHQQLVFASIRVKILSTTPLPCAIVSFSFGLSKSVLYVSGAVIQSASNQN